LDDWFVGSGSYAGGHEPAPARDVTGAGTGFVIRAVLVMPLHYAGPGFPAGAFFCADAMRSSGTAEIDIGPFATIHLP
jgi:hypothetical protein